MNILPKKRWHVRTKDNIARVRRDEAEAAEKDRIQQEKLKFAESEARLNFLRQQAGATDNQINVPEPELQPTPTQHFDLFADFQSHIKQTNKEHELEKKEEKEKYEKQIGYLTYLGQDTNEALKLKSWYEKAPKRIKHDNYNDDDEYGDRQNEKDIKNKYKQDPLTLIKALLPSEKSNASKKTESSVKKNTIEAKPNIEPLPKQQEIDNEFTRRAAKRKHKKEKHSKSKKSSKKGRKEEKRERMLKALEEEEKQRRDKRDKLEKLREERLIREAKERERQEALFAAKNPTQQEKETKPQTPRIVQKYNSQFNPELAKQNMM